jgi:drug/metabolite transporter (DMT)-like permease
MLQQYLWFIYALTAAVLWGIHYATAGELSKSIPSSLISLAYLVLVAIAAVLGMLIFRQPALNLGQLATYLTPKVALEIGVMALTGCISNFLVFSAIADSTATKASIIEITYPFFVALFATLLYREKALDVQTGIGGLLILTGVFIVLKS